jgi:WD40 repeat protein
VEAVFLPGVLGRPEGYSALRYLKASAYMNAASYAFLAVVLAGLIYLPALRYEDRALAKAVSGKVAVASYYGLFDTVDLPSGRPTLSPRPPSQGFLPWELTLTQDGSIYGLSVLRKETARYIWSEGGWRKSEIGLPRPTEGLIAISPDRQFLLYSAEPASYIKRVVSGQTSRTALPANLERGSFSADNHFLLYGKDRYNDIHLINLLTKRETPLPDARAASFNPVRSELAWIDWDDDIIIYDCLTGKKQKLSVPGEIAMSSSVAWSPDGKYLAYLGGANPFTWQRFTPDLRVVEVASGKSATVYRGLWTGGGTARPFWLP